MSTASLLAPFPLPRGVSLGRTPARAEQRIACGTPALDRLLDGGFPRGQLSEIFGPPFSGRTSLAYRLLAAATARGEVAALIDCHDRFDPRTAEAAGLEISRLLWVRPPGEREALRASEILLATRGLGLVLLDFADGIPGALAARFASAWPRLARQAATANAALVLLSRERLAGSFAALCIALHRGRSLWARHALRAELFGGIASRAEVVRRRNAAPGGRAVELRS